MSDFMKAIDGMIQAAPKTVEEAQQRIITNENLGAAEALTAKAESLADLAEARKIIDSAKAGLFTRRSGLLF